MPTYISRSTDFRSEHNLHLLVERLREDRLEIVDGLMPSDVELHVTQSISVLESLCDLFHLDWTLPHSIDQERS